MNAIGTEVGGRTLALGRNLASYVIAADLVGLDSGQDTQFRAWLRQTLTEELDGKTLQSTHEIRANNWGTMAGASRAAVAAYLGDQQEMERVAKVFKGWLGDRASYAGFSFGSDLSWQADPAKPVGVNPIGAIKEGHSIDGALPDDMRRGGSFTWPPVQTNYPWGALQGAVTQAEILFRSGFNAWQWQDRALLRAVQFLNGLGWKPGGDDQWIPWLIDSRYGTQFATNPSADPGKIMGWTAWTHQFPTTPGQNLAPIVNAGPTQSILVTQSANLDATVVDDGLPSPQALNTTWLKLSGPGTVTFGNAGATDTTARFSSAGTYVLQLLANDGALSGSDVVSITVNRLNLAPTVYAGADQTILLSKSANLDDAIVADDGLPNPPAKVSTTWRVLSGPGTVTFANALIVDTVAQFSVAGNYELQLQATDGALTTADTVTISVLQPNAAPSVSAGPDQVILTSTDANLDGTVTDDGLPKSPGIVAISWKQLSGPGTVAFVDAASADTAASFSASGTYVLQLRAYDGELASTDTVAITLGTPGQNQPPFVDAGDDQIVGLVTDEEEDQDTDDDDLDIDDDFDDDFDDGNVELDDDFDDDLEHAGHFARSASVGGVELAEVSLHGTAIDDGQPISPGAVTTTWTKLSGPGEVTFDNAAASETKAWFIAPGVYELQLLASDGQLTTNDTITITITLANRAPRVDAGNEQTILVSAVAALDGTVSDDGHPLSPGTCTTTWTLLSGPGTVTFENPAAVDTTARFSAPGTYMLRLVASDGSLVSGDNVFVIVRGPNRAPVVDAGPDRRSRLNTPVSLNATVTDDGQPNPLATIRSTWTKVSGPGDVTFANAATVDTTARFSAVGTYLLRLQASDGQLNANDTVSVVVSPQNLAPAVRSDNSLRVQLGDSVNLSATVTDDSAIPQSNPRYSWIVLTGPGQVIFSDNASLQTAARFRKVGMYKLRLIASDGELFGWFDVSVKVDRVLVPAGRGGSHGPNPGRQ